MINIAMSSGSVGMVPRLIHLAVCLHTGHVPKQVRRLRSKKLEGGLETFQRSPIKLWKPLNMSYETLRIIMDWEEGYHETKAKDAEGETRCWKQIEWDYVSGISRITRRWRRQMRSPGKEGLIPGKLYGCVRAYRHDDRGNISHTKVLNRPKQSTLFWHTWYRYLVEVEVVLFT